EPHLRHRAGTEVFEHDIRGRHQRSEDFLTAWCTQVEAKALLAAIIDGEVNALAPHQRLRPPRLLAAQLFDLESLGAEVGEDHAAARSSLISRQFKHPHTVETPAHRVPPQIPLIRPVPLVCGPAACQTRATWPCAGRRPG